MNVGIGRQNIIILFWSFTSGNTLKGTRHLYWILTGPLFAVQLICSQKDLGYLTHSEEDDIPFLLLHLL
jgi:hypothetical protein